MANKKKPAVKGKKKPIEIKKKIIVMAKKTPKKPKKKNKKKHRMGFNFATLRALIIAVVIFIVSFKFYRLGRQKVGLALAFFGVVNLFTTLTVPAEYDEMRDIVAIFSLIAPTFYMPLKATYYSFFNFTPIPE